MDDAARFSLAVSQITGKRLTYKRLMGKLPDEQTPVDTQGSAPAGAREAQA